jgi:hypothetical protein
MEALLKSFTLLAGLALAAPASAERQPSPPAAIANAVTDCWAAVRPNSVDQTVLQQRGWQQGTVSNAQGTVETPLKLFGKSGSDVMVMLTGTGETPMCSVLSRVENPAAVSSAAQAAQRALVAADPEVKTARSGKSIVFISLPRIATLDATGSKDKPAVRIVVGYQKPGK